MKLFEDIPLINEGLKKGSMGNIFIGEGIPFTEMEINIGPIPLYFKLELSLKGEMDESATLVKTDIPGKKGEHISVMGIKSRTFQVVSILSNAVKYLRGKQTVKFGSENPITEDAKTLLALLRHYMDNSWPIVFKFGEIHTGFVLITDIGTRLLPNQPYDVAVILDLVEFFRIPYLSSPLLQYGINLAI